MIASRPQAVPDLRSSTSNGDGRRSISRLHIPGNGHLNKFLTTLSTTARSTTKRGLRQQWPQLKSKAHSGRITSWITRASRGGGGNVRRHMLLFSMSGLLATLGIAQAHDLNGLVAERTSLDPETRAKFEQIDELRRLLAAQSKAVQDEQLEAV